MYIWGSLHNQRKEAKLRKSLNQLIFLVKLIIYFITLFQLFTLQQFSKRDLINDLDQIYNESIKIGQIGIYL